MSAIRPVERDDLPAVAALYERVMRPDYPVSGLAEFFARTLLDHPWVDPEIPSLVYTEDGKVVGFIGSQVRRMEFDGRPIRISASSHLIADPGASLPVGALLMRKFLAGPQQLTVTDTSNEAVRPMWSRLGGQPDYLGGIEWIRVLRPGRIAAEIRARRQGRHGARAGLVTGLLDALATRAGRRVLRIPPSSATSEPLVPAAILEHLPAVTDSLRLRPAYDAPFLEWLFRELGRPRRDGDTLAALVRSEGRALGWYICRLTPGGLCQVLQIAARDADAEAVLDRLLKDAAERGAGAVRGRVEPRLLAPVAARRSVLRHTGAKLIHSRDAALVGAITSGSALLTFLDGEWAGLP